MHQISSVIHYVKNQLSTKLNSYEIILMYIFEFAQLGMALVIDIVPPILNGRHKEVTEKNILVSD